MKKTRVIINDKTVELSSKAMLLFTNLSRPHFILCVFLGIFLYDMLYGHRFSDFDYSKLYWAYVGYAVFLILFLIRTYLSYNTYKEHNNRFFINKGTNSIDYAITFKEQSLLIDKSKDKGKDKEKINVNYKDIIFIGKIDLFYFIMYFDKQYYISAIGNVNSDDEQIKKLLKDCKNIKVQEILSYDNKRNICIFMLILSIAIILLNFLQFV